MVQRNLMRVPDRENEIDAIFKEKNVTLSDILSCLSSAERFE